MSEAKFRSVVLAAIAVIGIVAYANTLDGEWVWDDASSVLLHRHVQDPAQFLQLFREDQHAFGRGQGNFYRPLVSVSFMVDFLLSHPPNPAPAPDSEEAWTRSDPAPTFFHLGNIAWHVLAAALFFALLTRLGAPRFVRAATPLLFVVHPLHTEAVAYISGRADMMAGAFMFAGLVLASSNPAGPRRIVATMLAMLCFVAALLSKEAALIFPVLLLLILALTPARASESPDRRARYLGRAMPLAAAAGIVLIYGLLRATLLKFGEDAPSIAAPFSQRIVETLQAFALYMKLLFLPTNLHMERTLEGVPGWAALLGALLLLACIAAFAAALRTGHWRIALGLAWFIAAWLPISGLFPLNAPMAEHWMYVPMAGFWWALLEGLALLAPRALPTAARAVPVYALALLFLVLTVHRNQDWHDNVSLYRATLEANPKSKRVHYNLAVAYEDLVGNAPGARRHFERVLELDGVTLPTIAIRADHLDVHLSLGEVLLRQERYAEASTHFALLVNGLAGKEGFEQYYAPAMLGLGRCLLAQGQLQPALEVLGRLASEIPLLAPQARALLAGAL